MRFAHPHIRVAAAAPVFIVGVLLAGLSAEAAGCARIADTILVTGEPATGAGGASDSGFSPPLEDFETFAAFMHKARGDKPDFLRAKWERYLAMIENFDLWRDKEKRAFLATAREEFSRSGSAARTYAHTFLDIGCGVTISGPHIVGRMTSELDVQPGDRVLEIGTGSGYQAALLTYLTPHVYSVEIIPSLSESTDRILDKLTDAKYIEFARVLRKTADGYFGWAEHAPFDKIIVTAGIDHIPPPLVKQLADGGVMVIPVGPPGAQSLLKLTKTRSETGRIRIKRHDIYAAQCSRAEKQRCKRKVSFVALTKYRGGKTVSRWGRD